MLLRIDYNLIVTEIKKVGHEDLWFGEDRKSNKTDTKQKNDKYRAD